MPMPFIQDVCVHVVQVVVSKAACMWLRPLAGGGSFHYSVKKIRFIDIHHNGWDRQKNHLESAIEINEQ